MKGNLVMISWEKLPEYMQVPEVRPYYDALSQRKAQIVLKRCFDIILASILLACLAIPMIVIACWIRIDSEGPVLYRQERVTTCGRHFWIHKFRTMVSNADKIGSSVTVSDDERITSAGKKLRQFRLDELPQLIDVLQGTMSFVGTRPEAAKYVLQYKPEYYATLLLPAGITSETSIRFKDESKLLAQTDNVDRTYVEKILPAKMKMNLESIIKFNLYTDVVTMVRTVLTVLGKEYC